MWKKGDILISESNTLIRYISEKGYDEDTFTGVVLESEFWKKGKVSDGWTIESFTLATIENTPKEWYKYLDRKENIKEDIKEYTIVSSERYKYSKEFLSKSFKIIEEKKDTCIVELLNTNIKVRTIIPKFDIVEVQLYTIEGSEYSNIISNFLKGNIKWKKYYKY